MAGTGGADGACPAERGRKTLLLEKRPKPGTKILLSGGTRCNLTHATDRRGIVEAFGGQGRFLHSALAALGPEALVDWFQAEGVATKIEADGKVFQHRSRRRRAGRPAGPRGRTPFTTARTNPSRKSTARRKASKSSPRGERCWVKRWSWPPAASRIRPAGRRATNTLGRRTGAYDHHAAARPGAHHHPRPRSARPSGDHPCGRSGQRAGAVGRSAAAGVPGPAARLARVRPFRPLRSGGAGCQPGGQRPRTAHSLTLRCDFLPDVNQATLASALREQCLAAGRRLAVGFWPSDCRSGWPRPSPRRARGRRADVPQIEPAGMPRACPARPSNSTSPSPARWGFARPRRRRAGWRSMRWTRARCRASLCRGYFSRASCSIWTVRSAATIFRRPSAPVGWPGSA